MGPPKEKEQQRTRRTVKACVICHKKKVRCDIDNVEGEVCSPCARDGYECIPRERKRKRFTFSPSPPAGARKIKSGLNGSIADGSQPAFSVESTNYTDPSDASQSAFPNESSMRTDGSLKTENSLGRRLSSATSLHDPSIRVERNPESSYPGLTNASSNGLSNDHSMQPDVTNSAYPSSTSQTNVVSYLGRLEYLRNDVPVDDDAGLPSSMPHRLSEVDLETLRVHRVSELPPRPVRESLLDAFWSRCHPWNPVVERSWVENRDPNQVSLLLLHAMLLAGSRVSAPLPNYPSADFYRKARVLFWTGAEEDPIITIAACICLHWWNPEGPEQVSVHTSSFWLRICIGLALQVGLHRDPGTKPNAGLRRRLWWSLVCRDALINAGHGRPRAIDLKLSDVAPISVVDFEGMVAPSNLFSSYVGICCILGDLTQSYLRKHGLQEHKKSLEDRLFRWLKTLPENLQLCRPIEGRPLKQYSFETRQLHIQYFTTLIILNRPVEPKASPSLPALVASSFIAGIFEDFMARDELRYLGPIFTFYCLTAGMAQLSCYRYSSLIPSAEQDLAIMGRALEELGNRWATAAGSLKHLFEVREKVTQRPSLGAFPDFSFPATTQQFFSDFGPDLCRMWHPIFQQLPQTSSIAPRELETAGILQGLRTPNTQPIDLDINANTVDQQQQLLGNPAVGGAALEPTLLQPQEWFGTYGGIGNWLMVDWDQGFGW
ncbi:hypothetical protein BU24DRAFT_432591 [Aaosphaeria arxii CBS 175.79]|uniref:Zn(2)-C6 fungal-type domain-containing protein n=1 Tax=Aaosphaeria arxii CBS 175.79 TaxID=1450172 RepID=A0A6A5XZR3_9PLEO|nr:uncharacterized protein BU24DRAFT_432591 [Aaosphaeria arxii CBS 175.79]KAF2018100.1 hypothetical protein BU24DRAFT_432591 [Aaosphaeria arxii CBS 175.79]